jgi:hypothetical protein
MDRRTSIKWVLAAGASWALLGRDARAFAPLKGPGYGTDPDLSVNYHAGQPWPLSLSAAQRRLAATLSDIIIPADEDSVSASAAGVVDFIDEWLSAPYPEFERDRGVVLGGFYWLDSESQRRFGKNFIEAGSADQMSLCDDICDPARAGAGLHEAAQFFARYRDLTAGGFYTSPIGRADLKYIGNVPLKSFAGPPPELLKKLGLA